MLTMACYGGLWGILAGLTKSTDHPGMLMWIPQGALLVCARARMLHLVAQ